MSLSKTVNKAVEEVIHTFIQQLSDKYELDSNELLGIWEGTDNDKIEKKTSKSSKQNITTNKDDLNEEDLSKYKKTELQSLCREKGLKCTGTKVQLIACLLGKDPNVSENSNPKKPVTKNAESKVLNTPVAKKLTAKVPTVAIRRNQFGNHEHPETSLVFDKISKKVIGKQNDDGNIDDLTSDDINICNQFKFDYILPDNLDKKTKLDSIHVEELDDDVEDDEELIASDDEEDEVLIEDELLEEEEDDGDLSDEDFDDFEEY
jgi:hypothetical protein